MLYMFWPKSASLEGSSGSNVQTERKHRSARLSAAVFWLAWSCSSHWRTWRQSDRSPQFLSATSGWSGRLGSYFPRCFYTLGCVVRSRKVTCIATMCGIGSKASEGSKHLGENKGPRSAIRLCPANPANLSFHLIHFQAMSALFGLLNGSGSSSLDQMVRHMPFIPVHNTRLPESVPVNILKRLGLQGSRSSWLGLGAQSNFAWTSD
jgi:hypothetical protein